MLLFDKKNFNSVDYALLMSEHMKSPDGGRSNMLLVIVRPTSGFLYQLYPIWRSGHTLFLCF